MNDALVVYIHRIISKRDGQGRGSIDIDRYMEWNDIGLQTGPGMHNRRTENIVALMPTSAGSLSPRFPQQQNGQQKTNSIEILLVHRAGICLDHCRVVRSNQSQVSTTSTGGPGSESLVDGYTWWQLAHTQLTRDPMSRQHQHQPAHRRQTYPNS
jgi:hypothetical protein